MHDITLQPAATQPLQGTAARNVYKLSYSTAILAANCSKQGSTSCQQVTSEVRSVTLQQSSLGSRTPILASKHAEHRAEVVEPEPKTATQWSRKMQLASVLGKAGQLQPVAKLLNGVDKLIRLLTLLEGGCIHKVAIQSSNFACQGLHQHANGHS